MPKKKVRNILGLCGGKLTTALAILLYKKIPEMEYFFCDTHKELPETYQYLDRIRVRLGIKIHYLSAERGFDHWLAVLDGLLPSPHKCRCTVKMKAQALEAVLDEEDDDLPCLVCI